MHICIAARLRSIKGALKAGRKATSGPVSSDKKQAPLLSLSLLAPLLLQRRRKSTTVMQVMVYLHMFLQVELTISSVSASPVFHPEASTATTATAPSWKKQKTSQPCTSSPVQDSKEGRTEITRSSRTLFPKQGEDGDG